MLDTIFTPLLHLNLYLARLVNHYGSLSYLLLIMIIFAETGLVITPFLPGDSVLFAAGIIAAHGALSINLLVISLIIAATLGNTVNYWIGNTIGHRFFKNDNARLFKKRYLDKTHQFYEKYGAKTLILSRFIPFLRTYAPFVAGAGGMNHWRFTYYNFIGASIWVSILLYTSFFFGNIEWVKNNFSILVMLVIVISIAWPIIAWLRHRRRRYTTHYTPNYFEKH